jgi:DNA modification methylase
MLGGMARNGIPIADFQALQQAALDRSPVKGLTHNFYRYPARFSPLFAAAAIERFSSPGDVVLDPYMGGGTSVVEAFVSGRRAVGNDLNELSAFVVKAKTTLLTTTEQKRVREWVKDATEEMHFRNPRSRVEHLFDEQKTHNLSLPSARPIKKALAQGLLAVESINSQSAKAFARCALLRLGQWALDGRKVTPTLSEVRAKLPEIAEEMLLGMQELSERTGLLKKVHEPIVLAGDAGKLHESQSLAAEEQKADLVVTSPPYAGVHMLYHRWQINGRREAPAPYWLTACDDGHGAAYYNFADRRAGAISKYFDVSLGTLNSLRRVVKKGAMVVQMVAFSEPEVHLPLYLDNMDDSGFREVEVSGPASARIWRDVPGRKWHASLKGLTNSAREIVLVHRAV